MNGLASSLVAVAAVFALEGIAQAQLEQKIHSPIVYATRATTVPFEFLRHERVVVQAEVNGHPTLGLLDSGASVTILDRAFAESIGIRTAQRIGAYGMCGRAGAALANDVKLEIGGVRFEKMSMAVMDLSGLGGQGGRPVSMIVGREFFESAAIRFNWDDNELNVIPGASFTPPTSALVLPAERRGSFNFVNISIAGQPIDAMLDLGNDGTLALPRDYWSNRAALTSLRYADTLTGGIGSPRPGRDVTLPSVQFAGRTFDNVPALLDSCSYDGPTAHRANLGLGMLSQFNVVLDLGHDRIFLAPRSNPTTFARDRTGLLLMQVGSRLRVSFSSPQGPGARAGLKVGDEIVAINGQPIAADFFASPLGAWNRAPSGTPVTITTADGRTPRFALEDYY